MPKIRSRILDPAIYIADCGDFTLEISVKNRFEWRIKWVCKLFLVIDLSLRVGLCNLQSYNYLLDIQVANS